jgi:hypothetical protein
MIGVLALLLFEVELAVADTRYERVPLGGGELKHRPQSGHWSRDPVDDRHLNAVVGTAQGALLPYFTRTDLHLCRMIPFNLCTLLGWLQERIVFFKPFALPLGGVRVNLVLNAGPCRHSLPRCASNLSTDT